MNKPKLIMATLLAIILAVCLSSVPALSGENPWDADGGGGAGTGNPQDTIASESAVIVVTPPRSSEPSTPPALNDVMRAWIVNVTIRVSGLIQDTFTNRTSKKARLIRPAN